jgi:hypothetical protein
MKLYHYSVEPFVLDQRRVYQQTAHSMKPSGLWLSVESTTKKTSIDWREWCLREDFALDRLTHRTEVVLASNANVLHLDTEASVLAFARQYETYDDCRLRTMVDWPRVARDYQGLIIAPYQWGLRLDIEMLWYYGWDCAAGCIWDCTTLRQVDQPARGLALDA